MVGGKILPGEHSLPQAQLYNRFRCVYVCVWVYFHQCVHLWLPEQGMAAFAAVPCSGMAASAVYAFILLLF